MADIQGNIIKVDSLVKQLNDTFAKHISYLDSAADSLNRYGTTAKLPSEYINNLKSIDNYQKKIVKSTKDLEREQKKLQKERLADLRLQKKREQAFDKYERQLEREQRALNRNAGLYNRIQRGINNLTREYNDLAVKRELNGRLTEEEVLRLSQLEGKLNKYQTALKKVDSNIQKYGRNVGNYASGWNGLSNSINQLTREAPAFANSVQTGFMALSNNIPILTDEINRLISVNKELQAQGKPTTSVFKQILTSVFSLQTAMSLGITLLVIYGKEIGNWMGKMFGASDAASNMTKNVAEMNKELAEMAGQNIGRFKALIAVIQSETKAEEDRLAAKRELAKDYPDFNQQILDEKDATQAVTDAIDIYITKLEKKAKAQAAMNTVQEKYVELIKLEQERADIEAEIVAGASRFSQEIKNEKDLNKQREMAIEFMKERSKRIDEANKKANATNKTVNTTASYINRLNDALDLEAEKQDEINQLIDIYVQNVDFSTQSINNNTKALEENKRVSDDVFGILEGTIPYYEEIISGLKTQQEELSRTSKEWYAYQEQIDDFTGRLEVLQRMLKGDYSISEGTEKAGEMIDKLVSGFSLDNDKKEEVKSNWKDTFNNIVNVANRAFGIITALSDASFQKQYDNLERQKEVALQFAGESTTAREEIERQYEEKRKAIEQRQAKAKKEQALFNITVDTASAVVQALPNIPLAVVIGALGAAQLALVASQQIPQFWEGGIVGGSQQIMVNDDPYGKKGANYKEVVRKPNGQTLFPQGKNVKMTVPKGTEIFPTYDAFMSTLNTELGLNGIGLSTIQPNVNVNGGITESQIRSVMAEHGKSVVNAINNKTEYHVNWDENGMNKYIVKGNTKREVLNARFRGKGRSV